MANTMGIGQPRYTKGSTAEGACGIYWKLPLWFDYIQSIPFLGSTVEHPENGLRFLIRGAAYLVASCSVSHLNISIINQGKVARFVSHRWVLCLAYCSDKHLGLRADLWCPNILA